ncbi:flagellar hook-length control protein FliK [Hyphococcus sp.]|uniref:flagellar hook-length control protein FliK n=1 Tax=Hyphococcus sp. TaxID=2038636 RepID=UPI003CCC1388
MENTHLAFLTSLGGKLTGEGASGAKSLAAAGGAEGEANGFFAIVNRLLTGASGGTPADVNLSATPDSMPGATGELFEDGKIALTSEPVDNIWIAPFDAAADGDAQTTNTLIAATAESVPAKTSLSSAETLSSVSGATLKGAGLNANTSQHSQLAPEAGTSIGEQRARESISTTAGGADYSNLHQNHANKPIAGPQSQIVSTAFADMAPTDNQAFLGSLDADAPAGERSALTRADALSAAGDKTISINPVRDQIVAAVVARQGEGRLEVRLDPPELGRVLINFEGDGAELVRAVISADTPETLDLMRRHADAFQRALQEQGFEGLDLTFAEGHADHAQEDNAGAERFLSAGDAPGNIDLDSSLNEPATRYIELGRLDRRL